MNGQQRSMGLVVLLALGALSVGATALLVLALSGAGQGAELTIAGTAEINGTTSEGIADVNGEVNARGTAPYGDGSDIDAEVEEQLHAQREEKRERFIAALLRQIESNVGRTLSVEESGALSQLHHEYFSILDERYLRDYEGAHDQRIGDADQARMEVISRIAGSEGDAIRVLTEAMNTFEAEGGDSGSTVAGTGVP